MQSPRRPARATTLALAAIALAGCATPAAPTRKAVPAITVTDGGEIAHKNAEIVLTSETRKLAADTFPYAITYVSQVPAVKVGAKTVQANDIVVCSCGSGAFIAYNEAGDGHAGAVQILDTADKGKPAIRKEIKFASMDVNALYHDGDTLYFAGQADPAVWRFNAFIGKIDLDAPDPAAIGASLRGLSSFAATSITKHGGEIHVGVGAREGGVEVLSTDLQKSRFLPLADVRSIDTTPQGALALAGTTDNAAAEGRLVRLGAAGFTAALGDFESDYAKATLQVDGGKLAFLGLSKLGIQVRDLASRAVVYSLPNPTEDPLHAANGVSVDADLAFVANGGYGFRVLQVKDRQATGDAFASLAGHHAMTGSAYDGKRYSANFLRYAGQHLFVASGLGGVNIYRLTSR